MLDIETSQFPKIENETIFDPFSDLIEPSKILDHKGNCQNFDQFIKKIVSYECMFCPIKLFLKDEIFFHLKHSHIDALSEMNNILIDIQRSNDTINITKVKSEDQYILENNFKIDENNSKIDENNFEDDFHSENLSSKYSRSIELNVKINENEIAANDSYANKIDKNEMSFKKEKENAVNFVNIQTPIQDSNKKSKSIKEKNEGLNKGSNISDDNILKEGPENLLNLLHEADIIEDISKIDDSDLDEYEIKKDVIEQEESSTTSESKNDFVNTKKEVSKGIYNRLPRIICYLLTVLAPIIAVLD